MHHWVLRSAFGGLALWLLFVAWAQRELAGASSARGGGGAQLVLVLYDERGDATEIEAILAANLSGRFGTARVRPFGRYRSGDLARADGAIVLPGAGRRPPEALLADVRAGRRPVLWVAREIGALFDDPAFARAQGWTPGERGTADWVAVRYKGRDFPRDLRNDASASVPAIADSTRARTYAVAVGRSGAEVPWAVRSGALLYLAESPLAWAHEDDRYLVFADLLYEMLAPATPERHRAMVRIDAVGPDASPRRIRALADLLAGEGVPFSVAVYDSYRDPGGRFSRGRPVRIALADRPQLVAALRHAVARGGTLVAQGHTQQTDLRENPYSRVSGGDFEFFAADIADGAFILRGPLPGNSVDRWRRRLAASIGEWARAGLARPLVFTTPRHAASAEAYAAARQAYRARYERTLYFPGEANGGHARYDGGWASQFYPFEVVDVRGDFIIPENLGFASAASGRDADRLIAAAARNLAVRDGFASFYHPWHESPEALRTIVRGIKALGYRFVSPGEVISAAPAHAARSLDPAAPVAAAASGWVGRLPSLAPPLLVALLALVAAMWLGGETLLRLVPARPRRAAAA